MAKFVRSGLDRIAFDIAYRDLLADKTLKTVDLIAIAQLYSRGKSTSKKTEALEAIRKRFVELRQIEALSENAAKARPW